MAPIITLTTDFGEMDGYVASMKGVILGICPTARLVDVTHFVVPQEIRSGAYILKTIAPYFPPGTVHLAVVDPGVGSSRKAIAIRTEAHLLVGPDNGLFSFILKDNPPLDVHSIENPRYILPRINSTFHGRDIFAPAAAHLASGLDIVELGPPCPFSRPDWSTVRVEQNRIRGEVIHIDRFGNCITNVEWHHLQRTFGDDAVAIVLGGRTIPGLSKTYSDVPPGTLLALIGSSGHLEVAINGGQASSFLGVQHKHEIAIFRVKN
jgi:S-adenosyl-L-methionine hydrolase (adenosine-forming)